MWLVNVRLRLVLVIAALLGIVAVIWQARQISLQRRQHSEDGRLMAQYVERLHRLEQRGIPSAMPKQADMPPIPASARRASGPHNEVPQLHDAQIQQLRQELSGAYVNVARLEARIATLDEQQRMAAARQSERDAAAESDWKGRMDMLSNQLESAQKDAAAARQRVAALEAARAKPGPSELDVAAQAEVARLLSSLQELNRRRDDYLTAILRRYRDVSNEFRAMSGVISSSHDQNANAMTGPTVTRIQSTVSMAEDDLRQINELNVQVQQVAKKLAAVTARPTRTSSLK